MSTRDLFLDSVFFSSNFPRGMKLKHGCKDPSMAAGLSPCEKAATAKGTATNESISWFAYSSAEQPHRSIQPLEGLRFNPSPPVTCMACYLHLRS